jgi:hypothetical protein
MSDQKVGFVMGSYDRSKKIKRKEKPVVEANP